MSPLLWKPENWPSRLEELEARTGDLKEAPLRRDVRSLGMLLGDVLREQAGERLFRLEEDLRQLSIERREAAAKGDATRAAQLLKQQMDRVAELDLPGCLSTDTRLRLLLRADQPGGDEPPQAAAHLHADERG